MSKSNTVESAPVLPSAEEKAAENAVTSIAKRWNTAVGNVAGLRREAGLATYHAYEFGLVGKGRRWESQRAYAEQFANPGAKGGTMLQSDVTLLRRLGNGVRLGAGEVVLGDVSANGHRSTYKGLESATSRTAYEKAARKAHRDMVNAKNASKTADGTDKSEANADRNAEKNLTVPNGIPATLDAIETLMANIKNPGKRDSARLVEMVEAIGEIVGLTFVVAPTVEAIAS